MGAVRPLFEARPATAALPAHPYVVTADGQRFLVNSMLEQTASSPLTLVVNWTAGLRR